LAIVNSAVINMAVQVFLLSVDLDSFGSMSKSLWWGHKVGLLEFLEEPPH
jgi:hypothetical protein